MLRKVEKRMKYVCGTGKINYTDSSKQGNMKVYLYPSKGKTGEERKEIKTRKEAGAAGQRKRISWLLSENDKRRTDSR